MSTHADKMQKNISHLGTKAISKEQGGESSVQFLDNRPEAVAQRKLQAMANHFSATPLLIQKKERNSPSSFGQEVVQRVGEQDREQVEAFHILRIREIGNPFTKKHMALLRNAMEQDTVDLAKMLIVNYVNSVKASWDDEEAEDVTPQEQFLGLEPHNAWRETIDGRHHSLGAMVYDEGLHAPPLEAFEDCEEDPQDVFEEEKRGHTEPGYLRSALEARAFVAKGLGTKLDADYLENIHSKAAAHKGEEDGYHGGYRSADDTEISASWDTGEIGNIARLNQAIREMNPEDTQVKFATGLNELEDVEAVPEKEEGQVLLHFLPKTKEEVKIRVNQIFAHYYENIKALHEDDEKIKLIAKTHRDLENLHPFIDANSRVNRLVLHKLLVENGFNPVILENPLEVHLKTDAEWANEIKDGMTRWKQTKDTQPSLLSLSIRLI